MDRCNDPRFEVRFRRTFSGKRLEGEGRAIDLSMGGCKVESISSVSAGSLLELRIFVPDLDWPLRVELARVQWRREGKFGVEFWRVLPKEQETLSQVLTELEDHGRSQVEREP